MRTDAVKYWEMIAADLTERAWTLGLVLVLDSKGRKMLNVDAHGGDGKRFVVRADQLLKGLRCPRMTDSMNFATNQMNPWQNVKSAEMPMTRASR